MDKRVIDSGLDICTKLLVTEVALSHAQSSQLTLGEAGTKPSKAFSDPPSRLQQAIYSKWHLDWGAGRGEGEECLPAFSRETEPIEIDYKGFAHVIMEAKYYDLPSASCRPRKTSVIV